MSYLVSEFGHTKDNKKVSLYTLKNEKGLEASFIDLGAVWVSMKTLDKDNKKADIVLGYDTVSKYELNPPHFGAVIGRCANRISRGKFSLEGKEYQLQINNEVNSLHSGPDYFELRMWEGRAYEEDNVSKVEFKLHSPDKDQGFDGNADIKVLAIKALSENPSNEEYLKGLLNTEKGKVKEEVYTALAKFDSVDIVEVWSKAFKKNVVKMANLLPYKIKDWMSNIIYRELVNLKEDYFKVSSDNKLTKEDKKKKLEEIRNKLIAILANTTNTDNEDIISILGDLVQIEPEYALISLKNICLSTKSEKAIQLAKDLFDKYENEDFLGTAFAAYVISEPKEKVFDRFSRYLSQKPLKSLTDKERRMQKAFFNSLWWVSVKDNKYCYRLTYTNNEKEECAFKDNLDSRFITYIINTEMEIDSRAYGYYIYMSNTKESLLSSLVIDDEKIKKEIGNYTYDRVRKQLLTQGEVNLLKLCDWKEYDDILKGTVDIANQSKKNFSYYELLRIENSLKELPVDDEKLKQIVDNALLNLQEKDTKKSTDKYTLKNTLTKISEQLGNGVKKEHLN
mgnify:CR=1 FL=1